MAESPANLPSMCRRRNRAFEICSIIGAWIAAAVRTIGGHLVTFHEGFRRLLGNAELTVLEPV